MDWRINVSILIDSQNIGFSIPCSLFKILEKQLLEPNRVIVAQPTLGANFQISSDAIMDFLGVSQQGVLVTAAVPGFPLHKAGVLPGDIIHSVNGFALDNFGTTCVPWSQSRVSATDLIALLTSEDKPVVVYSHNGQTISAELDLEDHDHPGQVCFSFFLFFLSVWSVLRACLFCSSSHLIFFIAFLTFLGQYLLAQTSCNSKLLSSIWANRLWGHLRSCVYELDSRPRRYFHRN